MVLDSLPVLPARICNRANEIHIVISSAVELKVTGIFTVYRGQVGGVQACHDEVHCAHVACTLFDNPDAALYGFEHVVFIESLYVIENLLRTDSPLFPDANALKLAVEDEDVATIEERHVVLDAYPLIPECAARMCQQQRRFAEVV